MGVLAVAHNPESAAVVRHSIADDLVHMGVDQNCIEDIVLVASELVTNALKHTATISGDDLDIAWEMEPNAVVVRVMDRSPALPIQRSSGKMDAHGRGLYIIAALALDWGVRMTRGGKQVWARVATVHP